MTQRMASRLEHFFEQRANGNLRSIIQYDQEGHDLVFIRDDVADRYTEGELETAVDESRMESLSAPIYRDSFSGDHGELTCMVTCFEHAMEMNFVLDAGVGSAVALDMEALDEYRGLVAEARQIVIEERG